MPHQSGGAIGVLLDLHDVLEGRVGRPVIGEQKLGIADDRGQHIVEVMGDAARELADGLHLLGLVELLLAVALLGGVEGEDQRPALVVLLAGGDEQPRRTRRAFQRGVDRLVGLGARGHRRRHRRAQGLAMRLGDAIDDQPLSGGGILQGAGHQPGEGGVGAQDHAVAVDAGDRHRGGVEETRETHFRRPGFLRRLLAGRAVERERARRAGRAVMAIGDPVQQARGQATPVAAAQVEVDLLGAHRIGRAEARGQHGGVIAGDDVAQGESAGADLGEVEIEPAGERRVHVGNIAVRLGREESGRRVIEEVDRVLQFLEDVFVALALARHVGNGPQRRGRAGGTVDRPDANAVPAEFAVAEQRRGEAQFLGAALALARGLGEAVKRFGRLGRAEEEAVHRAQAGFVIGAAQGEKSFVGVDDPQFALGDDHPVGAGVGDRLGDVVARMRAGELKEADGIGEQGRYAGEGEKGQQGQDIGRGLLVPQDREEGHDREQGRREQQHQPRTAGALRAIHAGMGGRLAHENLMQRGWRRSLYVLAIRRNVYARLGRFLRNDFKNSSPGWKANVDLRINKLTKS